MDIISTELHILLDSNKTIAIPNLGVFNKIYQCAQYNYEKGIFSPPCQRIFFQEDSYTDDCFLVQHIANKKNIPLTTAKEELNATVNAIIKNINIQGYYFIDKIGILVFDANHHLQLHAIENVSPSLFGLTPYYISKHLDRTLHTTEHSLKQTKNHYTLHINREFCNYVVAIIVAVIFYFLYAAPLHVENTSSTENQYLQGSLFPYNHSVDTTKLQKKKTKDEIVIKQQENIPYYTIVIAAYIQEKNAHIYMDEIKNNGFQDLNFINHHHINMIVYKKFKTRDEAQQELNSLKSSAYFKNSWITQISI